MVTALELGTLHLRIVYAVFGTAKWEMTSPESPNLPEKSAAERSRSLQIRDAMIQTEQD